VLVSILGGTSCAHRLPNPPKGELYLHNAPKGVALCTTLGSGKPCPAVPINQTDRFFMVSPATFNNVNKYIDSLIRLLESELGFMEPEVEGQDLGKRTIRPQDLRQIKGRLNALKNSLRGQAGR
jgi:hypothetical protein